MVIHRHMIQRVVLAFAVVSVHAGAFSILQPMSAGRTRTGTAFHRASTPTPTSAPASSLSMLPELGSFILSEVEVFDGSSIVDPVVVSGVFWTSLKGKLLSLIIGQILAAIVFAAITTFAATQVSQVGQFVSDKFSSTIEKRANSVSPATGKRFIKADEKMATPDFGKLLICLTIDILGSANEAIPVVGEVVDILYAPIAATLLRSLYGGSNVIFALEFAEEILPFTDIIPLATICWTVDTYFPDSDIARTLQLGVYKQVPEQADIPSNVVDATVTEIKTTASTTMGNNNDRNIR